MMVNLELVIRGDEKCVIVFEKGANLSIASQHRGNGVSKKIMIQHVVMKTFRALADRLDGTDQLPFGAVTFTDETT
jgi:hypothetical protein